MDNQGLANRFKSVETFRPSGGNSYTLLPLRFARLTDSRCVLSNEAGQYSVLTAAEFDDFIEHRLTPEHAKYKQLKSSHFLLDADSSVALDLLALKVRTKYQQFKTFTSLHLFVVSLRCDYSCPYCQVSRQLSDKAKFDMSEATALAGMTRRPRLVHFH